MNAASNDTFPLSSLFDALADRIADRVVDKLRAGDYPEYYDQQNSPLGPRRHIKAIKSGLLAGIRIGRRHLALRKDVEAFIAKSETKPNKSETGVTDLEHELGLVPNNPTHPAD